MHPELPPLPPLNPELLPRRVHDARANRCDFACLPIVKPALAEGTTSTEGMSVREVGKASVLSAATVVLSGNLPEINVAGVLSSWLDMDSTADDLRLMSESAYSEQVAYAAHLGLPAIIMPSCGMKTVNAWRHVHQTLLGVQSMQVWIRVPLSDASGEDTWQWWDRFRTACEHNTLLGVMLELSSDVPEEEALARWMGEPVRALSVSTDVFLTNKMGQPVLSKAHQRIIKRFMPYRPQLVIHGELPTAGSGEVNRHLRYAHRSAQCIPKPTFST